MHVLPQEMLGRSTFGLSMWLLKWLPIRLVDRFLLAVSWLMLGDTAQFGLDRPQMGPLELKNLSGKTPVLDVGTLAKIKSGDIKVQYLICKISNQFSFFFFLPLLSFRSLFFFSLKCNVVTIFNWIDNYIYIYIISFKLFSFKEALNLLSFHFCYAFFSVFWFLSHDLS